MVACVSPAASNFEPTLSTLRYAARARSIHNRVKQNNKITSEEEIAYLRAEVGTMSPSGNQTCDSFYAVVLHELRSRTITKSLNTALHAADASAQEHPPACERSQDNIAQLCLVELTEHSSSSCRAAGVEMSAE